MLHVITCPLTLPPILTRGNYHPEAELDNQSFRTPMHLRSIYFRAGAFLPSSTSNLFITIDLFRDL